MDVWTIVGGDRALGGVPDTEGSVRVSSCDNDAFVLCSVGNDSRIVEAGVYVSAQMTPLVAGPPFFLPNRPKPNCMERCELRPLAAPTGDL